MASEKWQRRQQGLKRPYKDGLLREKICRRIALTAAKANGKVFKGVHELCRKTGVPYDDVEDIVMASFWSCYKGGYLEKMTEPEIKKVLVRIVYNKCMDYHRKAAPTDIAAIEDCETELDKISYRAGNAVDKTVVSNENCQYIRDTIDGLKDIWREPVRMYFIEERSIPEISRALGITEEVCRSRISRARKCLKEKLKGLWEQFQ